MDPQADFNEFVEAWTRRVANAQPSERIAAVHAAHSYLTGAMDALVRVGAIQADRAAALLQDALTKLAGLSPTIERRGAVARRGPILLTTQQGSRDWLMSKLQHFRTAGILSEKELLEITERIDQLYP